MVVFELCRVDPESVQNCGMQITHMRVSFDSLKAKFIGCADSLPAANAATSQPHGKTMPVVIAARFVNSLTGRRASEFTAPDQQSFFPQT